MKSIILIGMSGAGKTVCGRLLADRLGLEFIDTDDLVSSIACRPISEILADGESELRSMEKTVCKQLLNKENTVIATGGGIVTVAENIDTLKKSGIVIFIDRPVDMILSEFDFAAHPLTDTHEKLRQLYGERLSAYNSNAEITVKNEKSISDCVDEIVTALGKEGII